MFIWQSFTIKSLEMLLRFLCEIFLSLPFACGRVAGWRPFNFMNIHSEMLAAVSKEIGFILRCIFRQ